MPTILPEVDLLIARTKKLLDSIGEYADDPLVSYERRDQADVEWGDVNAEYEILVRAREEMVLAREGRSKR